MDSVQKRSEILKIHANEGCKECEPIPLVFTRHICCVLSVTWLFNLLLLNKIFVVIKTVVEQLRKLFNFVFVKKLSLTLFVTISLVL